MWTLVFPLPTISHLPVSLKWSQLVSVVRSEESGFKKSDWVKIDTAGYMCMLDDILSKIKVPFQLLQINLNIL